MHAITGCGPMLVALLGLDIRLPTALIALLLVRRQATLPHGLRVP
jgi:hypothetical protein